MRRWKGIVGRGEVSAPVVRGAVGSESDRVCEAGSAAIIIDHHEVSILIRLGGWDRAGRAPSKVSTMIIRPPQPGHRRAVGGASVLLSASARERWGAGCDSASAWRARSMLRARTVAAKRP